MRKLFKNTLWLKLQALCSLLAALCFLQSNVAVSATYTLTKHGGATGNGVNRAANMNTVITPAIPYASGHCGHCHEQHASINGQEPTPPTAEGAVSFALFRSNFGANKNMLCYACHDQLTLNGMPLGYGFYGVYQGSTKYNNSIHYSSSNMIWPSSKLINGAAWPPYSDSGNCINCHNPHGSNDSQGLVPSMLIARDSKTADSPAYEMTCEGCHDGSVTGAKNIQAELNKIYAHPTHTYDNRHALPESGGTASFGSANRHAECVDCHNPHAMGPTGNVHTAPTNAVSDLLLNEWGVGPVSWPAIWSQPASFTSYKPPASPNGAQYEYQICFKCHSTYGLGNTTSPVPSPSWNGPSGSVITDQAWEFNPNNKSAHPVVVSLNNLTNASLPKALALSQMSSPWTNVGNQTMYCSDCHGADDEGTGGARGPHGSTNKYMLKGTNTYWPANAGGQLYMTNNKGTFSVPLTGLFCMNCHPLYGSGTYAGWYSEVHAIHSGNDPGNSQNVMNVACVVCHIVVPHGSKVSRLIAYKNMGAPYVYNTNGPQDSGGHYGYLLGFKKSTSSPSYNSVSNCWTDSSYSNAGSDSCSTHSNAGGYD